MKRISVAIAGNPNSGKSSIFNALTGARQHIGNYPGVTVEKKEGVFQHNGYEIAAVDLPGTYSLTSRSLEERIAHDYLIMGRPDIIIAVVDASNLERNLYLATQLAELDIPLILALNMSDRAKDMGQILDIPHFAELTNTLVVETVGHKKAGITSLKDAIIKMAEGPLLPHKVDFGQEITPVIGELSNKIKNINAPETSAYPERWLSIKLIEGDTEIINRMGNVNGFDEIATFARHAAKILAKHFGDDLFTILAEKRYGFISGLYHEIALEGATDALAFSERIDDIVTHRLLGLPIFFALMYLVFYLTFKIGEYPMSWIESFFTWTGSGISSLWPAGSESAAKSLIVDGVIGGVGGVIVFLPNIIMLFLAIAILEDTGYMSRAAFIVDRLMHKIGLHGKSFIPMLIGFGCTVPAIMATRIIEDRKDRITTMLVLPLMSCGARLTIYSLIIPAFFPVVLRAKILWLMYMIGIALAIMLAKFLKMTVLGGKSAPFVMELPPYRFPTIRGLSTHIAQRSYLYLKKAGTVILGISVVMWFLTSYPKKAAYDIDKIVSGGQTISARQMEGIKKAEDLKYSIAGRAGGALERLFKPLGFDWKISTALIGSFAAKEVFVAQMGIISSIGKTGEDSETLRDKLRNNYTPLTGFCVMLFCLIATPCMATTAITRRESGSWKWAALQFLGLTAVAYIVTLIVNQIGLLLGH